MNCIFCLFLTLLSRCFALETHFSLCCSRDVSSAGLVIANHQDIKSEIETRADSFTVCIEMGNTLLNNNHYASDEVQYINVVYMTAL